MKTTIINSAAIPDLLLLYENATSAHAKASELGDYRTANREYRTIAAVYSELRARGLSAQQKLLRFLNHPDPHVRVMAAAHALDFDPEKGEPILTELSLSRGVWALNARMSLEEWRKGRLTFP